MENPNRLTTTAAQFLGSALVIALVLLLGLIAVSVIGESLERAARGASDAANRAWISAALPEARAEYTESNLVSEVDEVYFATQKPITMYTPGGGSVGRAVAIKFVAPDGYHGDILLALGVDGDGSIIALRVLEHSETPGFGAVIGDPNADWMRAFRGRSLQRPAGSQWLLRDDGGAIDGISGATITANAVVAGVARALGYVERTRVTR
jgi:electron transport complex protein RnfG